MKRTHHTRSSGSLIQIENRKTLWTVSTPACVSWVCVDGSSARKPSSHKLAGRLSSEGSFKRLYFWDTKILQLTRYRMSLSKILAHLRQSWYTLGDNYYNNNSIKHVSSLFLSHGSRVGDLHYSGLFALWSPRYSCQSAVLLWGIGLCASVVRLCVRLRFCLCVCVNESLKWVLGIFPRWSVLVRSHQRRVWASGT